MAFGGDLQARFAAGGVDEALRVLHRRAEGDVAVLFVEVDLGARRGGVGGGRRGADELVVGELVPLAERREGVLVEVGSVGSGDFGLRVLAEPGDVVRGLRVGDG